jgi:membrane protease YdiL (CAAX protease family)
MEPIVPQQASSALDPSAARSTVGDPSAALPPDGDPPAAPSPAGDPSASTGAAAPRPTGVWSALFGAVLLYLGGSLAGFLLAMLVLACLVSPWTPATPHGPPPPTFTQAMTQPRFFVLSITLVNVCVALFALLAGRNTGRPWRERLGLLRGRVPAREFPLLVLASLGALGLGLLLVSALQHVGLLAELGKSRKYTAALARALASATPATQVALVFGGSVLTGLAEELVYRGYLQRALLVHWRPALAIGVSSALFAAMHGDLAYDVFVLPVGVLSGYLAWRADSIVPTIVCHASVNAIAQTGIAVFGKGATRSARFAPGAHWDTPTLALLAGALVVCAALVWIGIWRIQRHTRATGV